MVPKLNVPVCTEPFSSWYCIVTSKPRGFGCVVAAIAPGTPFDENCEFSNNGVPPGPSVAAATDVWNREETPKCCPPGAGTHCGSNALRCWASPVYNGE